MAAPSLVGSALQADFSNQSTWTIDLPDGLEAGETVVVLLKQSTARTISSISDGTNAYAQKIGTTLSGNGLTHLCFKVAVDAVAGGTDITVTWNLGATGRATVQRISASTDADVTGLEVEGTTPATSLTMADPGVTTDGDVILVGIGLVGGTGTLTAGTNWTILGTSSNQAHAQYRRSDAAIGSADVGPWTCSISRLWTGCLMAFYAAGGEGGTILRLVACDMRNISDMGGMRG